MLKSFINKGFRATKILMGKDLEIFHDGLFYKHRKSNWDNKFNILLRPLETLLPQFFSNYPTCIHIGVTTACNLKCPLCPCTTGANKRSVKHLDFNIFKQVVDDFKQYLALMPFWDWGEPFLHPRLAEMINYANKAGIRTITSTNANVNNSYNELKRIVESGLDVIIVCLDGATQESYEKYRVGGKLEEVKKTIETLASIKRELNVEYPVIIARALPNRFNEHELPKIESLAKDLGADMFCLKTINTNDWGKTNLDENMAPENQSLARYNYLDENRKSLTRIDKVETKRFTCRLPVYGPILASNGDIIFCCKEHEKHVFGNVPRDGSPYEVLFEEKGRRIRIDFIKNKGTDLCKNCCFRSVELPKTVIQNTLFNQLPSDISLAYQKVKL